VCIANFLSYKSFLIVRIELKYISLRLSIQQPKALNFKFLTENLLASGVVFFKQNKSDNSKMQNNYQSKFVLYVVGLYVCLSAWAFYHFIVGKS
jgi:hypothetical protein